MPDEQNLDKQNLFDFLEEIDKELNRKITLVAAGGTAMTLLDLKPSTIDIDFTAPSEDVDEFEDTLRGIPHGFRIDRWKDGLVFSQILPADYLTRSTPIKMMKNIELRALHPVDVIITKMGRMDKRDEQDIKDCIKKFKITKKQITERANVCKDGYVGNENIYQTNLEYILKQFFK